MAAVGEIFLSAIVGVLFEKLISGEMLNFFRREQIHTQVMNWERTLREIRAVLNDAEEKQIRDKDVNLWLEDLQDLAYDLDDLLDEFSTEALRYKLIEKSQSSTNKVRALIPTCCTRFNLGGAIFDFKMRSKIKDITTRLQDMSKKISELGLHKVDVFMTPIQNRERLPTTSATYEPHIYGRDKSKTELINLLRMEESNLGIIPIAGMGGIGKTTIAQVVYNDEVVKKHFDLKVWICVSDNFDIMRITKEIAGYVHVDSSGSKTLDQVQVQLKNALAGKKFLIVLDDVWDVKYNEWNILKSPFSDGAPGCKVIVTTRDKEVALMMGTVQYHALECLPHEECWSIFAQHAFRNINTDTNPNLESIGQEIVKKCGGLPLAARTLGGLLQCKPRESEWKNVLNSKIWELKGSDILPALRLSYHHLPAHLKQCFVYCAILPKDYEFEEKELVLLWMAEGFICQQEGGRKMEDLGGEYFRELLSRSFFQPSRMMEGSKFVMHDLINDLAQFFARQTCFRLEDNKEQYKKLKKARHSSYTQGNLDGIKKFENLHKVEHLRTFLPFSLTKYGEHNLTSHVPLKLLPKLKCLRVLSFSRYNIHELPPLIGEVKCLRYLNLSYTLVERLPESLGDLYNLQTLLLRGCKRLKKVPTSIENLINLRHLDITNADSLEEMPLGIDKLESLQNLSNFIITKDNGFRIRELGNLTNLGWKLEITGLQLVVDPQDARKANLNGKESLEVLSMVWSDRSKDLRNEGVETDVLHVLRPHSNLKELHIAFYHGSKFPTWIGDQHFSNMVCISLRDCKNCSFLPPLGQLSSLKKLFLEGISDVKQVGNEFYGQGCSKPFPVLKILRFENMLGWENWYPIVGETEVRAFTCLIELSIEGCPKLLGTLPNDLPCLSTLKIEKCPKLLLDVPNLFLPSITNISMEAVPCPSLPFLLETRNKRELNSLKSLDIRDVSIPDTLCDPNVADEVEFANVASNHMSSLTSLNFQNIQNLRFLPNWFSEGLSGVVESLEINDCNELTTLWQNVVTLEYYLPALRSLQIGGCPQLVSLFEEEEEERQHPQQQQEGMSFMTSLESLKLRHCEKLEKLPRWLHTLTFLGDLKIYSCSSLVSFPEKGFPSTLRKLEISECEALESLPEWMTHTNYNLEVLKVRQCPALKYIISSRGGLPPTLKQIEISSCAMLESLAAEEGVKINCPSLESFEIRFCNNLKFLPDALHNLKNLRRFEIAWLNSLESIPEGCYVPLELLPKLKCLRVLSFSSYRIREIPTSIGELKRLRYLNLSYTLVERLPESLGDLYNLQTLLLRGCERLKKFPTSIENLSNLRQLDITDADSLEEMPLGIDKLESLQKLSNFIITKGNGFRITELGNLTNLGGKLEITGLQNVVDPRDAQKVNLNGKESLDVLSMVWSKGSEDLRNEGDETYVLNVLRPHSNLKELHISFYHGSRFPTWIGNQHFSNMVCISLRDCKNCSSLPPLGQLRSLKELFLEGISDVKQVGSEFYGQGCSKPFPVLEILSFENMLGWENWYPNVGETEVRAFTCLIKLSIGRCPKLLGTLPNDLPCLRTLRIENCPKLLLDVPNLVLPSITTISIKAVTCPSLPWLLEMRNKLEPSSLKSLYIRDISIPDTLCDPSVADAVELASVESNHMSSLTSLNFQNIQNLRFLPKWFSEGLSGVKSLEINRCNELTTLWQNVGTLEHCFPALLSLQIWGCPQLVSLFEEEAEERQQQQQQQQQQLEGLSFMMSLESLKLRHCEKLEKLPQWLHTFPFLGELQIDSCPSLVSFPKKGFPSTLRKLKISACGALESLPEWMTHTNYNLEVLKVDYCPVLKYIISPRGGLPPSLKHLAITGCAMLESLAAEEGVKINCPSLESFEIRLCKKLKFLPDALHNLKNLRRFEIEWLNSLESIPEGWFSLPTNLREIRISSIENLDALPHSLQNNSNFPSLEVLDVTSLRPSILKKISFDRFSSLKELITDSPMEGMSLPTSLTELKLYRFPYLETLCSREFQKLTSLQVLSISWFPRLASVPSLPPSLQQLEIEFCDEFTSIPEQGLPQSLLELSIWSCPKFESFPEQGLPQSLLELYVFKCPKLKPLCEKDKGKYWPLIRHIPKVTIDHRSIFDT
ncbi:Disease resistance RPP13-like protein isoform 1 [Actinidia chinensis var. chinensis]|uniref:Disease resistance RPP13-like protein isoform 1 n=1 Tax=Actinidia chinensis var. chinensis TaxID=1590841 RepID=A0A2R6QPZ2_ACTCC|nr:Disease resistance RPP13-like protein isoform 1 [Actinidia chinensis var. chinensis]